MVSNDKYELPIAWADTSRELGEIVGVDGHSIMSMCSMYEKGELKTSRYIRVLIDDKRNKQCNKEAC